MSTFRIGYGISESADSDKDDALWIELFYDLAFVAGVTVVVGLVNPLRHHDLNVHFNLVVVVLFLMWVLTVLIFNFLPVDTRTALRQRIRWRVTRVALIFIQSAAMITTAVVLDPRGGDTPQILWQLSLPLATLSIAGLYGVGLKITPTRSPRIVVAGSLIVVAALVQLAWVRFDPPHFPWNLMALAAILGTAVIVMASDLPRIGRPRHLANRMRLLVLIVLGGAYASVAADQQWNGLPNLGFYLLTLLFPVAVFGAYFGMAPPIGKRLPRTLWWVLIEVLLAISILFTANGLALRDVEQGFAEMVQSEVAMGILFVVTLILFALLCLIGRQVQRAIVVTYLASAASLAVATAIAVSFEVDPQIVVAGQNLLFALTVIVVTLIAWVNIQSRSELPWSVTDY